MELIIVAPAQFVHQMFEMGRQLGVNWLKALLQPFADGVANGSAGPVIYLFVIERNSSIHNEFHIAWCD